MSRSLSRMQALLLGAAVLVGLGLATLGLFGVGSRHTAGLPDFLARWLAPDSFHLRAGFHKIHGVEVGTRVRVMGIEAGEVEAIERPSNPSGEVVLVMRIGAAHRDLIRADASAQIVAEGMVGGKVIEIHPGTDAAEVVQNNATIKTVPSTDVSDVLAQVNSTLKNIRDGEGSLGKLVKEDEAYKDLVGLLRQGRKTLTSLQQNSDAIKGMPLVRSYVTDAFKELVRPDCERNRRVFQEADLFEPGHAVLTAPGRKRLDDLAPWLEGLKHKGSEVVVASYAHPSLEPDLARTLTFKQSEAVCEYLTSTHAAQKLGWFSRRRVLPLGLGIEPPPLAEKEKLPLPRIEVLVFVPQNQ